MAELQLKSYRFREEREGDWRRLESLLARVEKGALGSLSDEDLLAIPVLYRAALSSLSVARAISLDHSLVNYLESLCARAYFLVYGSRASIWRRIGRFFAHDWPAAARALWRETAAAGALLALGAVVGFYLCSTQPDWFAAFVPPGLADGRDPSATTEALRQTLYAAPKPGLSVFAAYLFTHNAGISLFAFALGFAFGAPTAMLVVQNGCMLGAFLALFGQHGLGLAAGGWLAIHGVTELMAVTLAGAAGFHIGLAVAFPGEAGRLEAAAAAGRRAAVLMAGVLVMLVCAGMLEGIGRQVIRIDWARYAIGGTTAVLWPAYLYWPRRRAAGAGGAMSDSALAAEDPKSLRSMITPEGVDLRLSLADVGQRFSALALDLLILLGAGVALTIVLLIGLAGLAAAGLGIGAAEPMAVLWLLGGFVLRNFYFVAFEAGPRGATPGKRRMGLRVAARNGGRLTADAVFVRNALRELELYLPLSVLFVPALGVDAWLKLAAVAWCAVFALFPLFNRDRLRVGDLLAGTWVVRNPARRLVGDLTSSGFHERARIVFSAEQLDAYGIKELHVLEDVLRRFDRATVRAVADRICGKIGYAPGEESDGAFLNAYYAALRARLEARALMGRRRKDKYDRG